MNEEIDYSQYVCGGAHCKCLRGKAGGCPMWHRGDHTCSSPRTESYSLNKSTSVDSIPYIFDTPTDASDSCGTSSSDSAGSGGCD